MYIQNYKYELNIKIFNIIFFLNKYQFIFGKVN